MKIVLITYAVIALIWFILIVYSSFDGQLKYNQHGINTKINWNKIILATIFWPIDILLSAIKAIVIFNNK